MNDEQILPSMSWDQQNDTKEFYTIQVKIFKFEDTK